MNQREIRDGVLLVWNSAQDGDPKRIGLPVVAIETLVEYGLLEEFGAPKRYFIVTDAGKQAAGIRRG